jgi:hypothetical protein
MAVQLRQAENRNRQQRGRLFSGIFVTGGGEFIGSKLLRIFWNQERVTVLDNMCIMSMTAQWPMVLTYRSIKGTEPSVVCGKKLPWEPADQIDAVDHRSQLSST